MPAPKVTVNGLRDDGGASAIKAEDAAHASGDRGIMALVVRQDTAAALGADGDYVPLVVDSTGRLHVNASASVLTNLEKAEDAAHASGDKGVMFLAVRQDTAAALAADGDYVPFIVDASGRLHVAPLVASSSVIGKVGIDQTTVGTTNRVDATIYAAGSVQADGVSNTSVLPQTAAGAAIYAPVLDYLFNGTSWDRRYNNEEVVLLASAARTTTTNSDDQTNHNARGLLVSMDVSTYAATPALTLHIQGKLGDEYIDLLLADTAGTATGVFNYALYPGGIVADDGIAQVAEMVLPRTWRVQIVHGDSDSATYSVDASYIV